MNQRLPSGPAVIPSGPLLGVMPALNSVTVPPGVIRPIRSPPHFSVNQRLPSGPAVIPAGTLLGVMPALNSVTVPLGVIRPIWSPILGEPEVAIGPGRDPDGTAAGRDAGAEFGDGAAGGDPADLVAECTR